MDAPKQFRDKECLQFQANIIKKIEENKDKLALEFSPQLELIERILLKESEIESIEISLLRQSLINSGCVRFCVEMFNEFGMFGGFVAQIEFTLSIFTVIWENAKKELMLGAKKYIGKIPLPFAEKIMLEYITPIDEALAAVFEYAFEEYGSSAMKERKKSKQIECSMGEYRRFQFAIV